MAALTSGCSAAQPAGNLPLTPLTAQRAVTGEEKTPLLLSPFSEPYPFQGSDSLTHLVYEILLTNFSSGETTINGLQIRGADGTVLKDLNQSAAARQIQQISSHTLTGTMAAGTESILFVDITLPRGSAVPAKLSGLIKAHVAAAPPKMQDLTASLDVKVRPEQLPVLGAPLRGTNYVAGDACCSLTHRREVLPINGGMWLAQRFAIDWEQTNSKGYIRSGPKEDPKSFKIFGNDVLAVTNARVVSTIDGQKEQTPGSFPKNITAAQADGNSIILDIGQGKYALYAHLKTGSIRVKVGDTVKKGQVLANVGNTGNSLAPHLHFQVMDRPSSLASNGLPYMLERFTLTGQSTTDAFNAAEDEGKVLVKKPVEPNRQIRDAYPLDQNVVSLP
ncbi:M23 family metallopeptidase [Streptomyces sp. NPDC057910]|uniref:M23 family metallopeptidase n=1 Tax=Streptomyces sp. NPDC057910 TaxID=3346278 RepID=UPI0036E7A069